MPATRSVLTLNKAVYDETFFDKLLRTLDDPAIQEATEADLVWIMNQIHPGFAAELSVTRQSASKEVRRKLKHCKILAGEILCAYETAAGRGTDKARQSDAYHMLLMMEQAIHAIDNDHGNAKTLSLIFYNELLNFAGRLHPKDRLPDADPPRDEDKLFPDDMHHFPLLSLEDASTRFKDIKHLLKALHSTTCKDVTHDALVKVLKAVSPAPELTEREIDECHMSLIEALTDAAFAGPDKELREYAKDVCMSFDMACFEGAGADEATSFWRALMEYERYNSQTAVPANELSTRLFPEKYFPKRLLPPILVPRQAEHAPVGHPAMSGFRAPLLTNHQITVTDNGLHIRHSPADPKCMVAFITRGDEAIIAAGCAGFSNFTPANIKLLPGLTVHCSEQVSLQ
jgi:hypothetical protein